MNARLFVIILPLLFSCIFNNDDVNSYRIRFFCNGVDRKASNMAIIGNNNYEYDNINNYIGKTKDGTPYMYCDISEEIYKDIQSIEISVAAAGRIYIDIQKNNKTIIIVADEVTNAGAHSYKIK